MNRLFPILIFLSVFLHQFFDFSLFPIFSKQEVTTKNTYPMSRKTYSPTESSREILPTKKSSFFVPKLIIAYQKKSVDYNIPSQVTIKSFDFFYFFSGYFVSYFFVCRYFMHDV